MTSGVWITENNSFLLWIGAVNVTEEGDEK
jgi:hypothetical protein